MSRINLSENIRIILDESAKDITSLAKFIEKSVNDLMTTNYTNCKYNLDEDLAVFVGWSDGYSSSDISSDELYKEEDPTWRINVGIKVRNDADWADYDFLDFPWYPDGEVWDTGVTVNKNDDYMKIAEWMMESYPEIVKAHNNGEIYYYRNEEEKKLNESDSNNLYIDLDKLINLSNKYLDSNNINGKFYIDSDNKIRLELNNDSVDKWMNLNESSKEDSLKDNYTASSIAGVLNNEDDDYAIKIENRTTNKSTKWLNIKGYLLFDLWDSTTDMNSDNINKFKEN